MDSLKKLLGNTAPWLASALSAFGGPAGVIAGSALTALSSALGTPDAQPATIAKALVQATPEQMAALAKADNDFRLQMTQLGYQHETDLEKLSADDRASARGREEKTGDSWTPRILAGCIVGGFLITIYMVLSGYVAGLKDPMVSGLVGTLIGYISAKADQVIGYYFGSSAGSARKTELLNATGKGQLE